MLVASHAWPAARLHGRLGAGPHHLRRRWSFSGAGAPQSLDPDGAGARPAGCATRTRTAARAPDTGPDCGLRHVILSLRSCSIVTLRAGPTGLEIPYFPASGVNPSYCCNLCEHPSRSLASTIDSYFQCWTLSLTPKSSSHPRLRSLAVVDYGLSRIVLWRHSSPSRI